MEPGIYLEVKPATSFRRRLGDNKHTYLVYRKPDGTSEVIRGGFNPIGAIISVETRKSLEKSEDAPEAGEKPGSRPSRKLDISTGKLEDTWSRMRDKAEEIGKAGIDYRVDTEAHDPDQTSNSVIRAVLDEVGVPLEKALPEGITPDKLPGIRDNLAEKIEEAHRERERPNPIEGEIGGTDDQNPTSAPQSGDSGPSGHDDGANDDDSSGSGNKGDGDETQKQSLDLTTDPDIGKETLELKLGPDGEPISKELTPEQNMLLKDFDKNDGPLDDILAKNPRDLTEAEFLELKKEVVRLPAGPEQEQLDGMAMEFLEDKFGTGPVKIDAVGRMIDPEPIRPINKHPVPSRTIEGEELSGALKRIGKAVAGHAGSDGNTTAVQGLQPGLNILKAIMLKNNPAAGTDLKTDGIVGPKTRRALKLATSRLGRPKIEEGLALGRFGRFAQDVQTGRDDTRKLGSTIGKAFGPLFRNAQTSSPRPIRPAVENVPFQTTINDLGPNAFGKDAFKPIREDGLIRPKTESAFNAVLPPPVQIP